MINSNRIIMVLLLTIFIVLLGCQTSPPKQKLIDDAKLRAEEIMDSLRSAENIILDAKIAEEFFDDQANQYVINYNISTGLDSSSITEAEASMFIIQEKNDWYYNFSFNDTYRGILK